MSPMRPSPSLVDRVISTFSFDPKPLAKPTESPSRGGQRATRVGLRNDPGICQVAGKGAVECHKEGCADPVMNDRPGFHSIIPVSELIERVTQARAIEARDKV